MKKVFFLTLTLLGVFGLAACGRTDRTIEINIPDEGIPEDMTIRLSLYTGFGEGPNAEALRSIADEFESMYPNVEITLSNQGDYDDLRDSVTNFIRRGTAPALIMGYPDHYAEYASVDAIIPLDDYINHPEFGIADELDDFVPSFLAENQQFDFTYSLPVMKSTQIIAYNRDKFSANGFTFEEGEVITWDRLRDEIAPVMVGNGPNQCPDLLYMGSSGNTFINFMNQWGIGYTNQAGDRLFIDNRNETLSLFDEIVEMFDERTVVAARREFGQSDRYGSNAFRRGDGCMVESSSAGVRFNVTQNFDVGFLPIIQKYDSPDQGPMNVVQQGPNMAIGADTNDYERLAAWLFLAFATNAENSATLAVTAQYLPVRESSYETDTWLDFFNSTDPDDAPYVEATRAALAQQDWFAYEDAFVGGTGRPSSSRVRRISGLVFEDLWRTMDPEDTFNYMEREIG